MSWNLFFNVKTYTLPDHCRNNKENEIDLPIGVTKGNIVSLCCSWSPYVFITGDKSIHDSNQSHES